MMVLHYNYSNRNRQRRRRRRMNAPPSRAILMDMAVRRCDMGHATSEATGCRRIAQAAARATTNSTIMKHVPTLLAVSMAIVMQRYYTAHIARWRRFVTFIKATKRHHRTSTRSDIIKGTRQVWLFRTFHREKELQLTCWPRITIGVWHIKLTKST